MISVKSIALGDYLFFVAAGTAFTIPGAGTVSPTAKPGPTDPVWTSIGNVESAEPTISGEKEEEVWAPTGQSGVLSLKDVVQTKQNLEWKIVANEISPLAVQCFYRTGALDGTSTQFNPLSKVPPKGWLKIQRFDQDGNAHLVMDVYVRLKVTGGMKGGDGSLIKPEYHAMVLYSSLNVAAI